MRFNHCGKPSEKVLKFSLIKYYDQNDPHLVLFGSLAAESQEIQQLIADAGLAVDSLESGLAIHTWFKNIDFVLRELVVSAITKKVMRNTYRHGYRFISHLTYLFTIL